MSKQKPIVAVTGDFRPERYNGAALSWFNTGYYDSISAAGGLPLLLPPLESDEDLHRLLADVSGVVLSGCNLDLDPTRLKMHPHPAIKIMPKRREDFERRVAEFAIKRRIPVLAIGSGMQLVNAVQRCSANLAAGHRKTGQALRRSIAHVHQPSLGNNLRAVQHDGPTDGHHDSHHDK